MVTTLHDWTVKHAGADAVAQTFNEVILLDVAIRSGRGIGIKNLRQAAPEVEEGRIVQCFEAPEELQAKHQVLIPPDAYRRPEIKAFAKFFVPRYRKLFQ